MDRNLYRELIKAIKGDKTAINNIIKQQQANIYSTLFYLKKDSYDITDIAQEVMVKVASKITSLKNVYSFKPWLNKIIINSFYDYLKQKKKDQNITYIEDNILPNIKSRDETNPQENILNSELDYIIKRTISDMDNIYKIPITLREIQGLSYNQISKIVKAPIGTIKSRIFRAREIISDKIKGYINE